MMIGSPAVRWKSGQPAFAKPDRANANTLDT